MNKNYKIGDTIICVKSVTDGYIDDERLIVGESYTITDIDIHFPNKVCVKLKGPYYSHEEFVPDDCFSNVAAIREYKINQILQ